MVVNRSYRILEGFFIARRQLVSVAASLLILNSCLLSLSFAFPAQQRRRSMTIMDRLIGANPLRGFPSLGVQIPFQIYYPQQPQQQSSQHQPVVAQAPAGAGFSNSANYPQNQQLRRPLQPQPQPQTIQPFYYNAQPETIFAPISAPTIQHQQYQFQQQANLPKLPPRRPKFFRRGFRFPVPNPNYYRPRPIATINPYLQSAAFQQQTAELTERVKQAAVLKTHVDLAPLLSSLNTSGITVTTPTVGKLRNAHSQNEESYEKSSGSSNLIRVLVIRPSDLERMRNATGQMNISPKDFMKGYTIKYLAADGKQMVITTQTLPQSSESIRPTTNDQNVTCVEPFCDPFIRQLIPELMTAPPSNSNDEPIVIIKNSNDTRSIYTNIRNKKQRGRELFDIVNSVDVTLPVEEIQAEYDPLIAAPSQVKPRVHFPGKDLSAKINSNVTSSRKYYYNPPKLR